MSDTTTATQRAAAREVLRAMFADLDAAEVQARQLLHQSSDLVTRSLAHQILGIVNRERGDIARALRDLRISMRLADQAGDRTRRADAQATLGATLGFSGRTREGLEHLDSAIENLRGTGRAAALTRRAWVYLAVAGRYEEGTADLAKAAKRFAMAGDLIWQARALNLLGFTRLRLGDLDAANTHFEHSGTLSAELQHHFDYATTVQNRGYIAYLKGDLPRTLALLHEAATLFAGSGHTSADLIVDQCTAYLSAGLLPEATRTIEAALQQGKWTARERPELLHTQAQVALAAGDLTLARTTAERASRMLASQGRDWFAARAQFAALTARHAAARRTSPALRRDVLTLVEDARRLRMPELTQTLLLAATITRDTPAQSDALLAEAERAKTSSAALDRALGWLASARRRTAAHDTPGTLRASERGLAAIDEHQALLGSSELRALASARGHELAALALAAALKQGNPRTILHWSERWRGTAITRPRATPTHDATTIRDLAVMRTQIQQAALARDAGQPTDKFDRAIGAIERNIRERHLVQSATATDSRRAAIPELLTALREHDTTLVDLFTVDTELHAAVVTRNRTRHVHIGPLQQALQAQEYALFVLRRAGRGHPVGLQQAGERLQRALLGSAAPLLGSGPVLVSCNNQLQRVPWALLPALAHRPVSTTPSAQIWLRASHAKPTTDRRVFVLGPGLTSGGAEIASIRAYDTDATHLAGHDANVQNTLTQIEGAALVHIAAHGTFRADNPLFSAIDLDDGPLMVHDIERLHRAPHRVILSACETGDMQPVGADELLGLSVSLLAMGSTTVISSLVKVNDHATAEVMVPAHRALREGANGATAMLAARERVKDDPLALATAVSFTAFGM